MVTSASLETRRARSRPLPRALRVIRSRKARSATWMATRIGRWLRRRPRHRSAVRPRGDGDLRSRRAHRRAPARPRSCGRRCRARGAGRCRARRSPARRPCATRMSPCRSPAACAGPAGSIVTTMAARRRGSPSRAGEGNRLQGDAEIAARHVTLVLDRLHDPRDGRGRDREDAAARTVDGHADQFAVGGDERAAFRGHCEAADRSAAWRRSFRRGSCATGRRRARRSRARR